MSSQALALIIIASWLIQIGFSLGLNEKRPWTWQRGVSIAIALPAFVAMIWLVIRALS